MHCIHLSDELRITFPDRTAEFDVGVEVGGLAALMAIPLQQFTRKLSEAALAPSLRLADKLGYAVSQQPDGYDSLGQPLVSVTFRKAAAQQAPAAAPARHRFSIVGGTANGN